VALQMAAKCDGVVVGYFSLVRYCRMSDVSGSAIVKCADSVIAEYFHVFCGGYMQSAESIAAAQGVSLRDGGVDDHESARWGTFVHCRKPVCNG
jgi:hypothetical protein